MIKEKDFKLEEIKNQLQEFILDEEGYVVIPELEKIALEDEMMCESIADFLLNDEYKIKFEDLAELFNAIDVLMEFFELEETFSTLSHFDEEKIKSRLKTNISRLNLDFLEQFACGFDIAVRLINKYSGAKSLVSFLNSFERLENALALYTRTETLAIIEDAVRVGLKSKENHFKGIASKVYKNGGLYFINLKDSEGFSYQLNKYITLKLENNKTNIYVNNQLFNQCKFLFLDIPVKKMKKYEQIDSIDEAAEKLDRRMEGRNAESFEVSPAMEFWGHCSNIQAWVENKYDTRILHRSLSFPLLKRLTEVGDPVALGMFKEEIITRLQSGFPTVVSYLCARRYVNYLTDDDLRAFCLSPENHFIEKLILNSINYPSSSTSYIFPLVSRFQKLAGDYFLEQLLKILRTPDVNFYRGFAKLVNPKTLHKPVLRELLYNSDSILRNFYVRYKGTDYFVRPSLRLNLANKGITDIDEIEGLHRLKELRYLDLSHNKINEIKGLGNLKNLKTLKLGGNPIPRQLIEDLGGMTRTGKVKKAQNFVEYSRSKGVKESEFVIINGKQHEVLNKGLVLRNLGLNAINEIKGLDKIKELEMLDLAQNHISDLTGLDEKKSIKILNLEHNLLRDITVLRDLENLEVLRLRGNGISDLKCLESIKKLEIMDIESKRKIDDRVYLSYLAHCLLAKDMKKYCSKLGIVGHTKFSRYQLINLLTKSIAEETVRDMIYMVESEVITKGITNAINKIKSKKRENLRYVKLVNNSRKEIEIITNGHKRHFKTILSINPKNINSPKHSCNCKERDHEGLCDHFWMGFIFSLKMGYFKLEDWTLTPLPDDLEEKIKSIEFSEKVPKEYRANRNN